MAGFLYRMKIGIYAMDPLGPAGKSFVYAQQFTVTLKKVADMQVVLLSVLLF
jgi:hypothetical protein